MKVGAALLLIAVILAAGCVAGERPPHRDAVQGAQFDGWADYPSISADGRFVAFVTAGDPIPTLYGVRSPGDIFLYDQETGETFSIVNCSGLRQDYSSFIYPSLSGDGRYLAFEAIAPLPKHPYLLEAGNLSHHIYVFDRMTGEAEQVSVAPGGTPGNGRSIDPVISGDGRFITFSSWADNLVSGDTNGAVDVFVHDRETEKVQRVSETPDGTQASGGSFPSWISGDGSRVVFASGADNLVPGDENGAEDVFLYERASGGISLVSGGSNRSVSPAISADGGWVAFRSFSAGGSGADIFVYDIASDSTVKITEYPPGAPATGWSRASAISADGRYIAFESATALTAGDGNGLPDIFVYDVQTRTTTLVSVASDGMQGNGESRSPDLSGDGRYVAFVSEADNLVAGDVNGCADVFVHDRTTGRTTLVSVIGRQEE